MVAQRQRRGGLLAPPERLGLRLLLLHDALLRGLRRRLLPHTQGRDGGGALFAAQANILRGGIYQALPFVGLLLGSGGGSGGRPFGKPR